MILYLNKTKLKVNTDITKFTYITKTNMWYILYLFLFFVNVITFTWLT